MKSSSAPPNYPGGQGGPQGMGPLGQMARAKTMPQGGPPPMGGPSGPPPTFGSSRVPPEVLAMWGRGQVSNGMPPAPSTMPQPQVGTQPPVMSNPSQRLGPQPGGGNQMMQAQALRRTAGSMK